jgi:hypothetical protein
MTTFTRACCQALRVFSGAGLFGSYFSYSCLCRGNVTNFGQSKDLRRSDAHQANAWRKNRCAICNTRMDRYCPRM